ncbi:hypothetical protein ACFLYU_03345 [Candidatus Dependentiae bacterium]
MKKKLIILSTCISICALMASKVLDAVKIENHSGRPIKNVKVYFLGNTYDTEKKIDKEIFSKTVDIGKLDPGQNKTYDWTKEKTLLSEKKLSSKKIRVEWTVRKGNKYGYRRYTTKKTDAENLNSIVISNPDKMPIPENWDHKKQWPYCVWRWKKYDLATYPKFEKCYPAPIVEPAADKKKAEKK